MTDLFANAETAETTLVELDDAAKAAKNDTPKKRKNNPEQLRHQLILAAKDLMTHDGIANLSIQKVADAAGTSKGGLFHHFKNKEELLSAVIGLFIAQLNTAILLEIEQSGQVSGCFSKAYAKVMFENHEIGLNSEWAGLIRSITGDALMQAQWSDWLAQKQRQFAATDSEARHLLMRYAVDGAWFDPTLAEDGDKFMQVYQAIMAMAD